ncbi:hypothetical protein B4099_0581 [Heyndrickxia coagulans]|uniref:Uncharacterized protein n=1 Tax=Heyndrickxia coagulans TaxID=1398 RepID=A0A150KHH6_HEYCO|nr:hypothetical protein B4099_0581 [Heyndrickxia coagulans]
MDGKKGFSKRSGYQSFIAWEESSLRFSFLLSETAAACLSA